MGFSAGAPAATSATAPAVALAAVVSALTRDRW
jgi:hypothetical protein